MKQAWSASGGAINPQLCVQIMCHVSPTPPTLELFVIGTLGLATINMHTKFEVSSLSRSTDILEELNISNGSRDMTTALSGTVCHW